MKKPFILLSLLVLAFSVNAFAQKAKPVKKPVAGKAAKQITAKELFASLPNEYVNATVTERENDLIFSTINKPNYVKFMLNGDIVPKSLRENFAEPEGLGDMRIFHGKSSVYVGLRYQLGDAKEENPTVDTVRLTTILLECKAGKWSDVTASVMPKISIDEAYKIMVFNDSELKKENVWVDTQILESFDGLMLAGRIKGDSSVTTLKNFKWDGAKFVESE